MARLSAVLYVLDKCVDCVIENYDFEDLNIPPVISGQYVESAFHIMDHIVSTKFALLPPELIIPKDLPTEQMQTTITDVNLVAKESAKIKRLMLYKENEIQPGKAARGKLVPLTYSAHDKNKFTADGAVHFFEQLAKLGLGSVEERTNTSNKKTYKVFVKKPLHAMNAETKTYWQSLT